MRLLEQEPVVALSISEDVAIAQYKGCASSASELTEKSKQCRRNVVIFLQQTPQMSQDRTNYSEFATRKDNHTLVWERVK